jgi:acylphosphatase
MTTTSVRVIFSGKVQGVFFRRHVQSVATEHHLKGYAKNLENGDVEVFFEGELSEIKKAIEMITHDSGKAEISSHKAYWDESLKNFQGFKIL